MPRPDGPVYSIVVAAGDGTRFGGRKQLAVPPTQLLQYMQYLAYFSHKV